MKNKEAIIKNLILQETNLKELFTALEGLLPSNLEDALMKALHESNPLKLNSEELQELQRWYVMLKDASKILDRRDSYASFPGTSTMSLFNGEPLTNTNFLFTSLFPFFNGKDLARLGRVNHFFRNMARTYKSSKFFKPQPLESHYYLNPSSIIKNEGAEAVKMLSNGDFICKVDKSIEVWRYHENAFSCVKKIYSSIAPLLIPGGFICAVNINLEIWRCDLNGEYSRIDTLSGHKKQIDNISPLLSKGFVSFEIGNIKFWQLEKERGNYSCFQTIETSQEWHYLTPLRKNEFVCFVDDKPQIWAREDNGEYRCRQEIQCTWNGFSPPQVHKERSMLLINYKYLYQKNEEENYIKIQELKHRSDCLYKCCFHNDHLLFNSGIRHIEVWAKDKTNQYKFDQELEGITSGNIFQLNNNELVIAGNFGRLQFYRINEAGKYYSIQTLEAHKDPIRSFFTLPRGEIVSASYSSLRVWNFPSLETKLKNISKELENKYQDDQNTTHLTM